MSVFDGFGEATIKFLEEARKNVRRYDAEPLLEVFNLAPDVFSIFEKSPGMGGDAWMHLIVGSERALLIDTGFGVGDVKALVETLTDKPYDVVNTHFHGDHTFGNYQFDKVYCHKYDVQSVVNQMKPTARDGMVPTEGVYFKPEDLVPIREYEVVGVDGGFKFNLGDGETVEVVHLPGHAPGGCGLLDNKKRILFSGDAIVHTPTLISGPALTGEYAKYGTVQAFLDELELLVPRMDEFDTLYPGHSMLAVPNSIVRDMRDCCKAIVENPDDYTRKDETMPGRGISMLKVVGRAPVAYNYERVRY